MQKLFAVMAAALGLVATPVLAAGNGGSSSQPVPLSDHELDQVTAGDTLVFWNVVLPPGVRPGVRIDPIVLDLTVPPNGTGIVQANYGGNAVFSASAIGMQNLITMPPPLTPSG